MSQPVDEPAEETAALPGSSNDAPGDDPVDLAVALPTLELSAATPDPVDTVPELKAAISALAAGRGPVAVDAERASGYRYGQRCYLVQLRREGAGTFLVDPIPFGDLSALNDAIADAEWVLHAASQDIPSLAELGLRPQRLFDTELGARIAGYERVGLAAMVETVLGYSLEKGHSSADWSQRPLAAPLLRYAALDVEVLVELRDHLEGVLREQDKWEWAQQEFAAVAAATPPAPRVDPWRRTSGIHRLRTRRQFAALRELWQRRDAIARDRDIAPGRILPDAALIAAVLANPAGVAELAAVRQFSGRATRRGVNGWFDALQRAAALPEEHLPPIAVSGDGPPPAHRWSERDPVAAARLARARAAVLEIATEWQLPAENLVEPAAVRRLAWTPPDRVTPEAVGMALAASGARPWQVELTSGRLAAALVAPVAAE